MHKLIFRAALPAVLALATFAHAAEWDVYPDTWAATDDLGRVMPDNNAVGDPRADRYVGMFYFLWLGQHGTGGPYDITKLLAEDPNDPAWGPISAFHHWGESQFGYYLSNDPWVIRKHGHELADAGIDALIFDNTNAFTYNSVWMTLLQTYQAMRDEGNDTPQVVFFVYNGNYAQAVQTVYEALYEPGLYPDLWFRWNGKPLLLSPSAGLSQEVLDFFTIRESWAWSWNSWFDDGRHKWPWLDDYPQDWGWDTNPAEPEEMAVAIASHPGRNRGRSFSGGSQPPTDIYGLTGLEPFGLHFEEQWGRIHDIGPAFTFVTGWNEWVAQRFVDDDGGTYIGKPLPPGGSYFVDAYNQEYNRDIEPMLGGHQDNNYYQLVSHVRRLKGVRPQPLARQVGEIAIDGNFADWTGVAPEFRDARGDAVERNHPGWGTAGQYVNETARNDFEVCKVAVDVSHVYFYARTREAITDPLGNWMLLLIDTDRNHATGWEGYDYIVNRQVANGAQTWLERSNGGSWNWTRVGQVGYRKSGNQLELAVPRYMFGGATMHDFEFKWHDNMQETGILEFPATIEGWDPFNNVGPLSVVDDALSFEILDADPFLHSPGFGIAAAAAPYLTLRMKTTHTDQAQIFWTRADAGGHSEAKSITFAQGAAGQFNEYAISLVAHPEWTGTITGLRLDPTAGGTSGSVEVDYLRLGSQPGRGDGIAFEWDAKTDRVTQFRLNGDAAPNNRFNYRYRFLSSSARHWSELR